MKGEMKRKENKNRRSLVYSFIFNEGNSISMK